MRFEWDHNKCKRNYALRGFDFINVNQFDWGGAKYALDERSDYGENRIIATGLCRGRLTILVFTWRGDRLRLISWRKANKRETKRWEH
ncbi:MAG: hypothetical protein CMQ15_11100 [Gammaproteobacteria bacterium]|jgi:hypothetical protein|nr:hypothetical protein [Gammaproteobacteria bacterium]HJN95443.1 BrnT family toxin [Gammaproteobacteria bacterium]